MIIVIATSSLNNNEPLILLDSSSEIRGFIDLQPGYGKMIIAIRLSQRV